MKRVALVLALAGCAGAQRHPALTAGIAGAVMGFGACEIDSVSASTCGIVGASTAVFLGGVAWLVTTLFDTGDHEVVVDPDDEAPPIGSVRVDTHAEPPPTPLPAALDAHAIDAGVVAADAPAD